GAVRTAARTFRFLTMNSRARSGVSSEKALRCMPAEKDLRPAPVRTAACGRSPASSKIWKSLSRSARVKALLASGRLKVIHQIPPSSRRSTAGLLRSSSAIDTLSSVVGSPAGHGNSTLQFRGGTLLSVLPDSRAGRRAGQLDEQDDLDSERSCDVHGETDSALGTGARDGVVRCDRAAGLRRSTW